MVNSHQQYGSHDEILVLGCGVIGLSTALRLQELGRRVRIISRDIPPHTTSDVAPAMWHPYKVQPDERMRRWAQIAFRHFKELSTVDSTGVKATTIIEYYGTKTQMPWYADAVESIRRLESHELPDGYVDGLETESFVIDSTVYMPYLVNCFLQQGGIIEQRDIDNLEEFIFKHSSVINCTGLGSRKLANDESLYSISGHVLSLQSSYAQTSTCRIDEDGALAVCYVVPRSTDVLIGGTAVDHDYSTEIQEATAQHILEKARILCPELQDATVTRCMVGLRPARPTVRVERDAQYPWLIHNYGHSGAGFTLSWGCAEEVSELLGCLSPRPTELSN